MSEKEKLTPVTSESQLRVGLLVEFRRCRLCQRAKERYLLMAVGPVELFDAGYRRTWVTAPRDCSGHGNVGTERAIAERRLFIVETGIEDAQDKADMADLEKRATLRLRRIVREVNGISTRSLD